MKLLKGKLKYLSIIGILAFLYIMLSVDLQETLGIILNARMELVGLGVVMILIEF